MNKEEVSKLAKENGATLTVSLDDVYWKNDGGALFTSECLLSFANACEKAGMEKAAKICDAYPMRDPAEDGSGYWAASNCAEVIRKAI